MELVVNVYCKSTRGSHRRRRRINVSRSERPARQRRCVALYPTVKSQNTTGSQQRLSPDEASKSVHRSDIIMNGGVPGRSSSSSSSSSVAAARRPAVRPSFRPSVGQV